jgi:signal transduction histidine kinase/DNA-binding response OmpR family regulator
MSRPLRVLLVEDSERDAALMVQALRRAGYAPAVERVETPEAMLAALDRQAWDVVLADYTLPRFDALAALALLKTCGLDLPFLIVSDNIGEETAVAAMKAGAHDYLMKGHLTRLVPAIERELREAESRRVHRRVEEERVQLLILEQAARAEAEAARAKAEAAERRAAFIAEASTILASSLDYEATLGAVARLAVPEFADYCVVDLLEGDQSLRRVAAVHRDPAKAELARKLARQRPPDLNGPHPIATALRTGQPQLLPELPDARLAALASTPEHLAILRQLASGSLLSVPLVARGRTLGVLTFVAAESGRRYGPVDQALAVDLARRAALSIDNARLYQEARAGVRLRDDFLARASHELRTPLTSALATVRLLKRAMAGTFKAEPEELVDIANRNLSAMLTLINDLLEASTLASGREPMALEPVDLATLVSRSLEVVGTRAREKLVALRVAVPAGLILQADPLKLKKVLVNLLDNAVKFTLAGGEVIVEAEAEAGSVLLRVRDTGMGIAHEHLEVIFEPFIQAGPPSRWRPHGTGMGLAICRQIVTLHGGRIWAESEGPGRGSTFTVRLQAALAATRAA